MLRNTLAGSKTVVSTSGDDPVLALVEKLPLVERKEPGLDDADDGDFPDTLKEILGASFIATPTLNFDDAVSAVDSNVNFNRTPLLPPPPPHFCSLLLLLQLLLGTAPEIQGVFTIIIILLNLLVAIF